MYEPTTTEQKWQGLWAERRTNEPDLDGAEHPYYNLMMFPYPSAEGLHVGNLYAFTGADFHGRYRRLRGLDVFQPIGFDVRVFVIKYSSKSDHGGVEQKYAHNHHRKNRGNIECVNRSVT